jgi:hypothetical protein
MTAAAVNVLVMEARLKGVCAVAGLAVSLCAKPNPPSQRMMPFSATEIETPVALPARVSASTARPTAANLARTALVLDRASAFADVVPQQARPVLRSPDVKIARRLHFGRRMIMFAAFPRGVC